MTNYIIRNATLADCDFLIDSIIAAEKSGSDVLSYNTIFGLSYEETRKYIRLMLMEEVDGCELSLSSFLVIDFGNELAASMCAWFEGSEGLPSSTIKGNLLSFTLPKESIINANKINSIISELSISYISDTLSIGLVYISPQHRGKSLVNMLLRAHIEKAKKIKSNFEIYIQVFANNIAAIKSYKKLGFNVEKVFKAESSEIIRFLPSNTKLLMKKTL